TQFEYRDVIVNNQLKALFFYISAQL
ncbi:hypothetical protein DSM3645_01706, partial [Blastopirellula marina DSM 3645]